MGSQEAVINGGNLDWVVRGSDGIDAEATSSENGEVVDGEMEKGNIAEEVLVTFEEYWDDVNETLMIYRIVSDSVMKGIVRAIEEEAAEKIATKELEVANLRMFHDISESKISHDEWQRDFSSKVEDTVIQTVLRGQLEELEGRLLEYNGLFSGEHVNWIEKFNGLSCVSTQLDGILKALTIPEMGSVSHELDPLHNKAFVNQITAPVLLHQGNAKLDTSSIHVAESYDFQQLKHFEGEELVDFFNNIITKIRRDHERIVQQKTEDYFRLKREYLKMGSLVTHSKDENNDMLRKRITEVVSKVDDFILENEKFPALKKSLESNEVLKKQLDSIASENQHLKERLTEKENAIRCLEAQVSDKVSRATPVSVTPDTSDIESLIMLESSGLVLTEVMKDAAEQFSGLCKEVLLHRQVVTHLETKVIEMDNELQQGNEERLKLKQEILDLGVALEEKEMGMEDLLISLAEDLKKQFKLASDERNDIRDEAKQLQMMVSETERGLELLKSKHLEQLKQIESDKLEINRLHSELDEAKRLVSRTSNERNNTEEAIKRVLQTGASRFLIMLDDFESIASAKMRMSTYRVDDISCHLETLSKTVNEIKNTEAMYKKILEVRCADLQLAETEVDLLADEVDDLLRLLEKIYIALQHYSPILMHYPGIVEILELIRRELVRDSTKMAH